MPTTLIAALAMLEPLEKGVGVSEKRSIFTPAGADQKEEGVGWGDIEQDISVRFE